MGQQIKNHVATIILISSKTPTKIKVVDSIIGIKENGHDMYYHYQYIHNMDRSSVLRGFTSRGQPPMHKLCPYFFC